MRSELSFIANYYCRRPRDRATDAATRRYAGEKQKKLLINADNTAIVCMHCPNTGMDYPEAPEVVCDPKVGPYFKDVNDRRNQMVRTTLSPFYDSMRALGYRAMYILAGWPVADTYPAYQQTKLSVKEPRRDWTPSRPPGTSARDEEIMGLDTKSWRSEFIAESGCTNLSTTFNCDIPKETAPTEHDWQSAPMMP